LFFSDPAVATCSRGSNSPLAGAAISATLRTRPLIIARFGRHRNQKYDQIAAIAGFRDARKRRSIARPKPMRPKWAGIECPQCQHEVRIAKRPRIIEIRGKPRLPAEHVEQFGPIMLAPFSPRL